MEKYNHQSRRGFVKVLLGVAGALFLGGLRPFSKLSFAETPGVDPKTLKEFPKKQLINPDKNPTAKSLKFSHDAASNGNRKNEKAFCWNCQMYRTRGQIEGVEVGGCNMIGGGYVKSTGWCTSWVRDPKKLKV